jgi:hypothetical protein
MLYLLIQLSVLVLYSGKFGEIELAELVGMLLTFAGASKTQRDTIETQEGEMNIGDIAHALLLFGE